jgi:hypothetical protein
MTETTYLYTIQSIGIGAPNTELQVEPLLIRDAGGSFHPVVRLSIVSSDGMTATIADVSTADLPGLIAELQALAGESGTAWLPVWPIEW